ncbi:Gfo/Idh/MocA family oxidoreductase [bacterium]|nr:Gfo/Idh/MocA family oxidoreductase [bacterium]
MSIRLGFIGTGGIAQGHMKRLSEMAEVQMAGYADVALDRAQKAAADFGGEAFDDYRKLLDKVKLDGVVICVPPFAHGDIEFACCDLGLPMLIEKPVAIDMEMAKPILSAIKRAGVATVVAYKYRWDDHVMKAKEMLADKRIGLVFGNFWGGTPGAPWWRVQAQSGGQFVEQTTHIVDMARYLCGDVVEVSGFETRRVMHEVLENYDIADAASANLRFASGAIGNISNTSIVAGWGQSSLRVMAHEFTLQVAGHNLSWAGRGCADGGGEYAMQADGYTGEDKAFVAACQGDRSLAFSDYEDAAKSLAVSVAVAKSAEQDGAAVNPADLLA